MIQLRNESNNIFQDISSEEYREYEYLNGRKLKIDKPLYLSVSGSGGHRLLDAHGVCWYVQPVEGWSINWKVTDDKPHFSL